MTILAIFPDDQERSRESIAEPCDEEKAGFDEKNEEYLVSSIDDAIYLRPKVLPGSLMVGVKRFARHRRKP